LPEEAFVHSIRVDSRSHTNDEGVLDQFDKVHITGEATDDATVSLFVESLMKSACFSNVSLQYSQQKKGGIARGFAISMEAQNEVVKTLAEVHP